MKMTMKRVRGKKILISSSKQLYQTITHYYKLMKLPPFLTSALPVLVLFIVLYLIQMNNKNFPYLEFYIHLV